MPTNFNLFKATVSFWGELVNCQGKLSGLCCKRPESHFVWQGCRLRRALFSDSPLVFCDAASKQASSTAKGTGWRTTRSWPEQEESALTPQRDKNVKLLPVQDEGIMNLDVCDLAKHETSSHHWLMCTSEGRSWGINSLEGKDWTTSQGERMHPQSDPYGHW